MLVWLRMAAVSTHPSPMLSSRRSMPQEASPLPAMRTSKMLVQAGASLSSPFRASVASMLS